LSTPTAAAALVRAGIRTHRSARERRRGSTLEARRTLGEQRVVRRAQELARTNPAYRAIFDGVEPRALSDIPPLTKRQAAELFDQLVEPTGITRQAARRYLEGAADPANTFDERRLVFSTSGSSGLPVYVVYDLADFGVSVAAFYEHAIRSREPAPKRLTYVGLLDRYNGGNSWMHHLRALMEVQLLDLFEDPERLYDAVRAFRPEAVLTRPHTLRALGRLAAERDPLDRPLLLSVGEPLARQEADEIERLWGVPAHNSYSTVETGPIGFQRDPREEALELYDDLSYVELLDDDDRPITDPGVPGRIAVTPLYNSAFPLLRYVIGDDACWIAPGERLSFPLGRGSDALVLVGGGLSCIVPSSSLLGAVVPGVRRYRIVQTAPAALVVEYEPTLDGVEAERRLVRALRETLREAGCSWVVSLDAVKVDSLPIDRASGKIKLLVRLGETQPAG
jgi:phenylacetate-CoA ligase